MQLATELEHHHFAHAPMTGCHDNRLEAGNFNVDNKALQDGNHGFTLVTECKTCKNVSDPSLLGNELGPHRYINMEDASSDDPNKGEDKKVPFSVHLPNFEKVKNETELYTDKAVTEIEAPKAIICFKEGSYLVVKDICVDEGVYLLDKVLVENSAEDKKVYSFNHSDERSLPDEVPVRDGLKSLHLKEEPGVDKENAKHHSFGSPLEDDGGIINEDVCSIPDEKSHKNMLSSKDQFHKYLDDVDNEGATECSFRSFPEESGSKFDSSNVILDKSNKNSAEKLVPLQEFVMGDCQEDVPNFNCECDQSHSVNRNSDQPQSFDDNCVHPHFVNVNSNGERFDQGAVEEANLTSSALSSAPEEPKQSNSSNTTEGFPSNGKVENQFIASDVDAGPPVSDARSGSKGFLEFHQPNQATRVARLQESSTDGSAASARSSFAHYGQVDSSLSGPAFFSGPNVCSGQIPYSGSISLRSDSSATSTRSFAFPILQSECNSSPVKMAKADRRRGWRSGLLCCNF